MLKSGAHTHVWVESRTPRPANMQVRTYHRQAVADLQAGKADGEPAGDLFDTTAPAPTSLFGDGSKTAAEQQQQQQQQQGFSVASARGISQLTRTVVRT